jgi:hypothetical protein
MALLIPNSAWRTRHRFKKRLHYITSSHRIPEKCDDSISDRNRTHVIGGSSMSIIGVNKIRPGTVRSDGV